MLGAALVVLSVVTPTGAADELLRRQGARDSLLSFIEYAHPGWETGEHHKLICSWLEKLERGEIDNLAVFAPPRHSKTLEVSRYFPAWCAGRNPSWEMLCVSKTDELAEFNGGKVRDVIASQEFQNVFPGVSLKQDSQAKGKWSVEHGNTAGAYYAAGVGGTIIGRGANLLDVDDPQDQASAKSETQRKAVAGFYFGDCVPRLMSPGRQLLTMTRRHEDDLAGRILGTDDTWTPTDDPRVFRKTVVDAEGAAHVVWHILRLRAIEHEGTDREVALWPGKGDKRFPLPRLLAIRAQMQDAGEGAEWSAQYQQDPAPEDGDYCRREWYAERWTGERPEGLRIYMTADPAVTEAETGNDPDFTEIGVFGLSGVRVDHEHDEDGKRVEVVTVDKLYELDWWYGQEKSDVWVDKALELARKWKPRAFFIARGQIANAVEPIFRRAIKETRTSLRIELISDSKDKGAKGLAFQRMSASGRIVFRDHPHSQRVIDQCVKFPNTAEKDAFDTMANMCRALSEVRAAFIGAEEPLDGSGPDWGKKARRSGVTWREA